MTVDRALLRAWWGPFVVFVAVTVSLLMLGHLRKLAAAALGAGLTLADGGRIVLAFTPPMLVFALPVAHLAAVLFSLGRMADDGELVALAAAGASPLRLVRVPVVAGVAVAVVGLTVAHWAQPAGWTLLQSTLTEVAARNTSAALSRQPRFRRFGSTTVFAEPAAEPMTVEDVVLVDGDESIVVARRGRVAADRHRLTFTLADGEVHPGDEGDGPYPRVRFEQARLSVDLGARIAERTRLVHEDAVRSTTALRVGVQALGPGDPRARRWARRAARRTALPALAVVFGWLAAGIVLARPDRRWRLGVTVILGFFVLMRTGDALVDAGALAPTVAVWGPHALLVAVGGWLLRRGASPR